jgi:hypothetical protein
MYVSSVARTTWKRSGTAVQLHMNCFVRSKNNEPQIQETYEFLTKPSRWFLSLIFTGTFYIVTKQNNGFLVLCFLYYAL